MGPGLRRGDDEISVVIPPSLRGARATTRLRLLRKLRRAGSPPKRLGAKAEAIQLSCCGKAGLLRFARNDVETHALVLTAWNRLSSAISLSLSLERGRRESRAPTAPAVPCAKGAKEMHTGLTTGTARTSRLSPRNGFTAYTCSPRGSGLSCPRCRREYSRQRSARVAAPGPHDFAVRYRRFRPVSFV
jgi:hypothetical protein